MDAIEAMLEQQLPPEDLQRLKHREKIPLSPVAYYACVARDVPPSERHLPGPKEALEQEWQRLRDIGDKGCWDEGDPHEFEELAAKYHNEGRTAHFGRIFEICVEKNSHLPKDDPARKYKGRVVYQGNNVTDQYGRAAIFEELSSCPATMAASKACDLVACLPDNDGQQSDAAMAYTQAPFLGTETWVLVPRHQWPKRGSKHHHKWYYPDGSPRFKRPCNRMLRALYGHPQSGGWWEQYADNIAKKKGYVPITNWRGCYFHPEFRIFLIIYVDDFKMAGPSKLLANAWALLREDIVMDDPTPFGLFLGCKHIITTVTIPQSPRPIRMIEYDVEGYLAKAVEDYKTATGCTTLQSKPTPFTNQPLSHDICAPHSTGEWHECPWCRGRFLPSQFGQGKGSQVTQPPAQLLLDELEPDSPDGLLGDLAMSILMKLLYAARYARHDILCAVGRLAQRIRIWSVRCDNEFHRLMGYVQATLHFRQIGWVGDVLVDIKLHLHSDADFAGCPGSKRSTTGIHLVALGPWTCFPINGQSKRQSAVSHSTPEAEIVAADTAMFKEGIPSLDLWSVLTGEPTPTLYFHEDNETMIRIMQTGRNPTMRHLNRTHGVDVSAMKEQFDRDYVITQYTQSDRQCADIHTKAFDNKDKWQHAANNINVFDKTTFNLAAANAIRQLPPADPKIPKTPQQTSAPAPRHGGTTADGSRRSLGDSPIAAEAPDTNDPEHSAATHEYATTLVVEYPPHGQWIRLDTQAYTFRTTQLPANATKPPYLDTPQWSQIYRRVTWDLQSQEIVDDICDEDEVWHDEEYLHRLLPEAPRSIATIIYFRLPLQSQLQLSTTHKTTTTKKKRRDTATGADAAQHQMLAAAANTSTNLARTSPVARPAIPNHKHSSSSSDSGASSDECGGGGSGSNDRVSTNTNHDKRHDARTAAASTAQHRVEETLGPPCSRHSLGDSPIAVGGWYKKGIDLHQQQPTARTNESSHRKVAGDTESTSKPARISEHNGINALSCTSTNTAHKQSRSDIICEESAVARSTHADEQQQTVTECTEVFDTPATQRGDQQQNKTSNTRATTTTEQTNTNHSGKMHEKRQRRRERLHRILEILRGTPFEGLKRRPDRVIVEVCCGEDSKISACTSHSSAGCLGVRVTIKDDFNSDRGIQKILDVIFYFADIPVVLWNTFPCTGGSAYNVGINWHKGTQDTRLKIAGHWENFRKFLANYMKRIAPHLNYNRFKVRQAFELPDTCDYWKWEAGGRCLDGSPQAPFREFLSEQSLKSVICHGCAFGLRATKAKEAGSLLRKTWRIATDCPHIANVLNTDCSGTDPADPKYSTRRLCPHGALAYRLRKGQLYSEDGTHARVQGPNTRLTESYNDEMVQAIHYGFADFARTVAEQAPSMKPAAPALHLSPARTNTQTDTKEKTQESIVSNVSCSAPLHAHPSSTGSSTQTKGQKAKPKEDESRPSTRRRRCSNVESVRYSRDQRTEFFDEANRAEASSSSSAAGPELSTDIGGLSRSRGAAFASEQQQLKKQSSWRPQLQLSNGARLL